MDFCRMQTIAQLTGAGLSELQDLARLGRTSEWVQVIGHTTRALLPRENDRLTIHWNGRLVGERCLPEQKGRPLLPFMQLDTDGKRGHPCTVRAWACVTRVMSEQDRGRRGASPLCSFLLLDHQSLLSYLLLSRHAREGRQR